MQIVVYYTSRIFLFSDVLFGMDFLTYIPTLVFVALVSLCLVGTDLGRVLYRFLVSWIEAHTPKNRDDILSAPRAHIPAEGSLHVSMARQQADSAGSMAITELRESKRVPDVQPGASAPEAKRALDASTRELREVFAETIAPITERLDRFEKGVHIPLAKVGATADKVSTGVSALEGVAFVGIGAAVAYKLYKRMYAGRKESSTVKSLSTAFELVLATVFVVGGAQLLGVWKTVGAWLSILRGIISTWTLFTDHEATAEDVSLATDQAVQKVESLAAVATTTTVAPVASSSESKAATAESLAIGGQKQSVCHCKLCINTHIHTEAGLITLFNIPSIRAFSSKIHWHQYVDVDYKHLSVRQFVEPDNKSSQIRAVWSNPEDEEDESIAVTFTIWNKDTEIVRYALWRLCSEFDADAKNLVDTDQYVVLRRDFKAMINPDNPGDLVAKSFKERFLPEQVYGIPEESWKKQMELRARRYTAAAWESFMRPLPSRPNDPALVQKLCNLGRGPIVVAMLTLAIMIYVLVRVMERTASKPVAHALDLKKKKKKVRTRSKEKDKEGLFSSMIDNGGKGCFHIDCPKGLSGNPAKCCNVRCGGHRCTHFAECQPPGVPPNRGILVDPKTGEKTYVDEHNRRVPLPTKETPHDDRVDEDSRKTAAAVNAEWEVKREQRKKQKDQEKRPESLQTDLNKKVPKAARLCFVKLSKKTCENKDCPYNHSWTPEEEKKTREYFGVQPCKRWAKCKVDGCVFAHPVQTKESIVTQGTRFSADAVKHTQFAVWRSGNVVTHFSLVQNVFISPAHTFVQNRIDDWPAWEKKTAPFIHRDAYDIESLNSKVNDRVELVWHCYPYIDFAWADAQAFMSKHKLSPAKINPVVRPVPAWMVVYDKGKPGDIETATLNTKNNPLMPNGTHDCGTILTNCGALLFDEHGKALAMHKEGGSKTNLAVILEMWKPYLGKPWRDGKPDHELPLAQ